MARRRGIAAGLGAASDTIGMFMQQRLRAQQAQQQAAFQAMLQRENMAIQAGLQRDNQDAQRQMQWEQQTRALADKHGGMSRGDQLALGEDNLTTPLKSEDDALNETQMSFSGAQTPQELMTEPELMARIEKDRISKESGPDNAVVGAANPLEAPLPPKIRETLSARSYREDYLKDLLPRLATPSVGADGSEQTEYLTSQQQAARGPFKTKMGQPEEFALSQQPGGPLNPETQRLTNQAAAGKMRAERDAANTSDYSPDMVDAKMRIQAAGAQATQDASTRSAARERVERIHGVMDQFKRYEDYISQVTPLAATDWLGRGMTKAKSALGLDTNAHMADTNVKSLNLRVINDFFNNKGPTAQKDADAIAPMWATSAEPYPIRVKKLTDMKALFARAEEEAGKLASIGLSELDQSNAKRRVFGLPPITAADMQDPAVPATVGGNPTVDTLRTRYGPGTTP